MKAGGTIVLTGATSGIGRALALSCAESKAHLILPVRNMNKGADIVREIERLGGTAELIFCDLASLESVHECAQNILGMGLSIEALVNNAGIFNSRRVATKEGYEETMVVNHLAPFLLTLELLEVLDRPNVRIITVSSQAHRYGRLDLSDPFYNKRYVPMAVYGGSKLANIVFTQQLSQKLHFAKAYSVHPGVVATNIGGEQKGVWGWAFRCFRYFMKTPQQGAQPILRLLTEPISDDMSGGYFNGLKYTEPSKDAQDQDFGAQLWLWSLQAIDRVQNV